MTRTDDPATGASRPPDLPWILLGGAGALVALFGTMAPGLAWEHYGDDGGELTVAVATLGVPHPSGYPFYIVLGHLFCRLFGWAGEPAFCTNLLSVAAGGAAAAAAVAISLVVNRRLRLDLPLWAVAVLATLGTLGTTLWSQAVITEVYVLHTALTLWTVALVGQWHEAVREGRPAGNRLWAAGLVWGLALGVHLTAGFIAFGLALLVLATDKQVFRRRAFWAAAATCLGVVLLLYGLLPVLARRNAPVNWGYIRSWPDLIEHVSGAQYRYRMFVFSGRDLVDRARNLFLPLLARQWGQGSLGLLALAVLWGLWACTWGGTSASRSYARRLGAGWVLLWFPTAFYSLNYNIDDLPPYFTTTFAFLGLLFPVAAGAAVRLLGRWNRHGRDRLAVVGLACLIPLYGVGKQVDRLSLRHHQTATEYGRRAFAAMPPGSLVVSDYDGRTNALLYERWLGRGRDSGTVVVLRTMLAKRWYRDHLRDLYPDVNIPEPAPGFAGAAWDTLCDHLAERILRDNAARPRFLVRDTLPFARQWRLVPVAGIFRLEEREEDGAGPPMRGRFRAVDLVPFANADYRGDPFLPGLRSDDASHFPSLGEGEIGSGQGVPFWLPAPWARSGRPSVITTCYSREFQARIPLLATATVALHLAVAGGVCRDAAGSLAFVQPWYEDGPGNPFPLAGLPDYRDAREHSLRFVRVPLDPARRPVTVEIASGRAVTSEPFVPGVAIFALTQELQAPPGDPESR